MRDSRDIQTETNPNHTSALPLSGAIACGGTEADNFLSIKSSVLDEPKSLLKIDKLPSETNRNTSTQEKRDSQGVSSPTTSSSKTPNLKMSKLSIHSSPKTTSTTVLSPSNKRIPLAPSSSDVDKLEEGRQRSSSSLFGWIYNIISFFVALIVYNLYYLKSFFIREKKSGNDKPLRRSASNGRIRSNYIQSAIEAMEKAETYKDWEQAAISLDKLQGRESWKNQAISFPILYDSKLIEHRLHSLRKFGEAHDVYALMHELRAGMERKLGGINNHRLFDHCSVGTKRLIEEYIEEVVRQLNYICDYQEGEEDEQLNAQLSGQGLTTDDIVKEVVEEVVKSQEAVIDHHKKKNSLKIPGGNGNKKARSLSSTGSVPLVGASIQTTTTTTVTTPTASTSITSTVTLSSPLPLEKKFDFFYEARKSFGRSALLLSGGATMAMYHLGVLKALFETNMLPRVISGSSAGSIIASLICVKSDEELDGIFESPSWNLTAFEKQEANASWWVKGSSLKRKLMRFLTKGVLMDISVLQECVRANLGGDITFKEAYDKTKRILNITVTNTDKFEFPRLLNYITAPNVVIWSAAIASSALPFLYEPVELLAKDKNGNIVPYHPSGQKWIDGSVGHDLPMSRLSELFNVNHFIVSQVNPHVAPFLMSKETRKGGKFGLISGLVYFLKSEIRHRMTQFGELGLLPTFLSNFNPILQQQYHGDITIVPNISLRDYLNLFSNPTQAFIHECITKGQMSTWSKISQIRSQCVIEYALEKSYEHLREEMHERELHKKKKSSIHK